MADIAPPLASTGSFYRARIASFLAIAPLGIWTALHLWDNLSAFGGAQAWEQSVTAARHPLHQALLVVVVLLPLVLHTVWGIVRLASFRPNNVRYGNYDNLKYLLQRLSAIGLLAFIGAHLWLAWAQPRFVEGRPEPFAEISHEMAHHTPTLVVYILGILAVSYHLANGIQTFAMGQGMVASAGALRRLEWVVYLTFAILLAMGWGSVFALWRAG
ncbi:MAG TPA: succinate dehydrogenase [Myxococcaceae bacterium]|jgi:succinate dehydrogenase / fumarate reductase cytochrome b subunit|nr:succinate dehydrogenase [Myxococcaceae bacterium]